MTPKITVAPENVWEYFHSHIDELDTNMNLIAETSDGFVGIYITEKDGNPMFVVEDCDEMVDEGIAINKFDCEEKANKLYAEYIGFVDENTYDNNEEIIDQREDELDAIFQNLIMDIMGNYFEDDFDDIVADVKEHTLEYMARKHGLPIFRPMFLEDENGDFFSEYPYSEMIFDDFNPVYDSD